MIIVLLIIAYILIGFIIGCCCVYYYEEWDSGGIDTIMLSVIFWMPLTPILLFLLLCDKTIDILKKLRYRKSK